MFFCGYMREDETKMRVRAKIEEEIKEIEPPCGLMPGVYHLPPNEACRNKLLSCPYTERITEG